MSDETFGDTEPEDAWDATDPTIVLIDNLFRRLFLLEHRDMARTRGCCENGLNAPSRSSSIRRKSSSSWFAGCAPLLWPLAIMEDDAWVLWVDASEGLSFDNTSLPDDYASNPFMSFVWREITRAETASQDSVVLPLFVFLRSAEVQNVTYNHPSNDPSGEIPPVLQPVSVPYYLAAQGLRRLMKVSVLRDPAFDWTSLDTPVSPSAGVKAQIVSYAYAHWQYFDIPPGQNEVPPLDESNDEGWKMRQKISRVRPIAGITFDTYPGTEPAGVPGPWAEAILVNTNPDFDPITDSPVTPTNSATAGVRTPLYDCVIRLNMRDGVWYEGDVSGNTPMSWDSVNEKWQTPYNPDTWPDQGVRAGDNPAFVDTPTPAP